MFWGTFNGYARINLVILEGDPSSPRNGIIASRILACLQSELPQIAGAGSIFIQDNVPTHTARLVQDWLIPWAEEEGVEILDWPSYSPDLNPIENVWSQLKSRITEQYPELALWLKITLPKRS